MSVSRVRKPVSRVEIPWKFILKAIAFILPLLALTISISKIKSADFLPIKDVKIFGIQHLDHQEVQQLITPYVSKGFFGVDVERLHDQLLQLSWVSHVSVRRVWPDQVQIAINEKHPLAFWNDSSLLSSNGVIFSPPAKTFPGNLPKFAGPPGEQIFMTQYYAKMNSILSQLHVKIARLELTPSMAWKLTLDNGMKMQVGQKDVLTRLNHFVKVYPKIVGKRVADVDYVDLRYPNGLAVRWKTVA